MLPNEESSGVNKPDPNVGKVFDKYRLIERLGAGGMGWVYRAEQARIKRHVAVKMLPFTMGNDEVNVKRIEREATAMGNLRHPNIATIFDFGFSDEGQPYLVMELISGRSLGTVLHEERRLEPLRAIKILAQVADAMDYAHKNNIIHRDLKPDNVMLTCEHKDDFVKILDFGIAKSVDNVVNVSQSLTRPGTVVGSPFYMSPEQCLGEKLDAGSDIYSFGVMLYELITGEVPCKGATIYETICKKSTEAPPPFPPQFAEWTDVEKLAQACLAPMRADRPESMQIVRDRLNALQPGTLDMVMPSSVQISLTAESVLAAQHAAVSNVPAVSHTPTDIYGAPLTPSQPRSSDITADSDTDNRVILQTPSQIVEAISDITEEQNTVVTSVSHDTANEIESLASGIETDAAFATVSTGVTLPLKSESRFGFKTKMAAIGLVAVLAVGGFALKIAGNSSNATTSGVSAKVDSVSPPVTTPAIVPTKTLTQSPVLEPVAPTKSSDSPVLRPDSIASEAPKRQNKKRTASAQSNQTKPSKAAIRQKIKNRRQGPPGQTRKRRLGKSSVSSETSSTAYDRRGVQGYDDV